MEALLHTNPLDIDREDLERRFRAGDSVAFDRIVTLHRRLVYSVARRTLRNHQDADEAAQITFVKAWKARSTFRGDAQLRSWLARIALNVAKSMLSSGKTHEPLPDEPTWVEPAGGDLDRTLDRRRLCHEVREAVRSLPARQQSVVMLKVYQELTYRQVAEILELTEGAVKAHLHQAISNLRKGLAMPSAEES